MGELIVPGQHEPPRGGMLVDARGAKLRRFARIRSHGGRAIPLDEDGNLKGEGIELGPSEVVIWDAVED